MTAFADLNLSPAVLKAIEEQGFTQPTPIQSETWPILLGEPTDFLGLAATGTGKTAAFAIPLIEKIDPKSRTIQAMVLCPTRELALQVAQQIEILGKYKNIRTVAVYGGASYSDQLHGLRNGASILVGTPGRVVDHMNRGNIKLNDLKTLILDEADEMISMGFREELERILESVPTDKSNMWFFSATMDKQVSRICQDYLRNPKQVQINKKEVLSAGVEQFYYMVRESDKPEILCKLVEAADEFYGLVFCQTKQLVTDLSNYLMERGYRVDCLHGDKDQNARERTMKSFRDRKVSILVCTDVAARGLDVKDVTHVINYSLPRELDNYVHRIGRTARSGKTGVAMNLVTPSHRRLIYKIEDLTKSRMIEGQIPSRREVGAKKIAKILPNFTTQATFSRAQEILGEDWKTALEGMSSEEVAARFIAMMMPDLFNERERSDRTGHASSGRSGPPSASKSSSESRGSSAIERRKPARVRDLWNDRGASAGGGRRASGSSDYRKREDRPAAGDGRPYAPRKRYDSAGSSSRPSRDGAGSGGGGPRPPRWSERRARVQQD